MAHDVSASGTFSLGEGLDVHRLGFGAMRVTGPGIWGPPEDRPEALRTLKRVPELGIDFIDTADSYGPYDSEELLAEALAPYPRGMVIATKGGLVRHGPGKWLPVGRPEYLRQCALMSAKRLRVERIDLWQYHRPDPKVPRDEVYAAMAELQKDGIVRHLGLSNVDVDDIRAARRHFRVVTVQNLYNLADRASEDVLAYCEQERIGFIPWRPLDLGPLGAPGGVVEGVARRHGVTPGAIALAWLLRRSPVMLPIPGTGKVKHLEENVAAAKVQLSDDEFRLLDEKGREASRARR
ncbi:MAG TPA: aldo/keto reductase [Anaeromyxobacter sp.]|nr:aldo/keto reductase [Anaeromyxobacter sp.]